MILIIYLPIWFNPFLVLFLKPKARIKYSDYWWSGNRNICSLRICESHSNLNNFANDITIAAFSTNLLEVVRNLKNRSDCAIKWFSYNCLVVYKGELQPLITEKNEWKINPFLKSTLS